MTFTRTLRATTSIICRLAKAPVASQSIDASTTILAWLSYAPVDSMLTFGSSITLGALTTVRLNTVHTRATVLTRRGRAIIDVELAIYTTIACLALA